jgi:hypothetical protein
MNLPIFLLIGNPSNPTTETIMLEKSKSKFGKDSKIVYINDSYNLDTIPFDVSQIIKTDELVVKD